MDKIPKTTNPVFDPQMIRTFGVKRLLFATTVASQAINPTIAGKRNGIQVDLQYPLSINFIITVLKNLLIFLLQQ